MLSGIIKMRNITSYTVSFGCDPEFFFSKNGKVVGAEKILPKDGLDYPLTGGSVPSGNGTVVLGKGGKVIIDGVQAELNPRPNTCRANLANEISLCFIGIKNTMKERGGLFAVDLSRTVKVSKKEFDSLSENSKKFGCAESKNVYLSKEESKITVDPTVYRGRSGAGHIHIGHNGNTTVRSVLDNPKRLVPVLDLVVGNTCVLIDRDKGNIERRKHYGRAGEYRTPQHGIEYRTLSNFWLQSYPLMSLVTGLARYAINIVASDNDKELLKKVEMSNVAKAINNNNALLARQNYRWVEKLTAELLPRRNDTYPLSKESLHLFRHFVKKGVNYWFKQDPLEHWVTLREGHSGGWEDFLHTIVAKDFKTKS